MTNPDVPQGLPGQARQHAPRGRFERSMETVRRDAKAAELRAEKLTYREIGERLGMNPGDAYRAVQRAKADVARPAVTKLIQTESEELDDLYVMALEIIERNHVVVSHGHIVCGLDGEPLIDDGPRLQAINTALRIRNQYEELHGLKAEQKVNVSGSVRYEVVGIAQEDLT